MCPDFTFLPKEKEQFTRCFGCGQDNPIGLKLKFTWDGETAKAEFVPGEVFQGWPGLTHGAIVITLLDEVMSYSCYYAGFSTVTGRISAKLKKPVPIGERLTLIGRITKKTRKLLETSAKVLFSNGDVAAEGTGTMYILNTNHYYVEDREQ